MFENITAAPADPILGLADLFRADERPGKINLGIGVYKDETGKTPVLTSVKKAEQYLLEMKPPKITSALTASLNLVAALRNCCLVKVAP
ncbi:aspartate aminotransferase [Escherichia coli]|uniref:Aspartate aminotransferase n=1 Tax=Escherichia coli TaxID=562 RepID=A0A3S4K5H2_ECOLX|nr:aspartate aminotransferase [Escherichia coli]